MKNLAQRYRYAVILLKQLVKTDFKLRYQSSVLGYVWSLLRPLALFAILYIVFGRFLNIGQAIPNFQIYLLLGIVLWNFFSETTNGSVSAIVGKGDLIRKINFPKYVIILATSISALINLLLNFVVVAIFMGIARVDVGWDTVLVLLLVAELFILALGLSFFLGAAFVRFRDISYIWEVILQGAFYATPILYPLSSIPERAAKILILNPVAQVIQDMRYILVTENTITIDTLYDSPFIRLVPILMTIAVASFAAIYFKRRSKHFAEDV